MPESKRNLNTIDKSQQAYYLSSYRELINKVRLLKLQVKKNELISIQEIYAEEDRKNISSKNGIALISKVIESSILIFLQIEKNIIEMREYVMQYELNNVILSKKINDEINELLELKRIMLGRLEKEYLDLQRKKLELQEIIITLVNRLSKIEINLNQIWKDQHQLVAMIFDNLNKDVEITLPLNDENTTIIIPSKIINETINDLSNSKRDDNLDISLESITAKVIRFSAQKIISENGNQLSENEKNKLDNICYVASQMILNKHGNFKKINDEFKALEKAKNENIKEKLDLEAQLQIMQSKLDIIESNSITLVKKINPISNDLELDALKTNFSQSSNLIEKENRSLKAQQDLKDQANDSRFTNPSANDATQVTPISTENKQDTLNPEADKPQPIPQRIALAERKRQQMQARAEAKSKNVETKNSNTTQSLEDKPSSMLVSKGLFSKPERDESSPTSNKTNKKTETKEAASDLDISTQREPPRHSF